jgi:hypothetical protein
MNCPHCKQEVQESQSGGACPHCGLQLWPEETLTETKPFKWFLFFILLFLAPVATMISAMLVQTVNENISPGIAILGGSACGIASGILLGWNQTHSKLQRFFICTMSCAAMIVVCVMLSFLGCNIGGYKMNWH